MAATLSTNFMGRTLKVGKASTVTRQALPARSAVKVTALFSKKTAAAPKKVRSPSSFELFLLAFYPARRRLSSFQSTLYSPFEQCASSRAESGKAERREGPLRGVGELMQRVC